MVAVVEKRQQERKYVIQALREQTAWRARLIGLISPEAMANALGLPKLEIASRIAQNSRLVARLVHTLAENLSLPEPRQIPSALHPLLEHGGEGLLPVLRLAGLVFNARRLGPVLTRAEIEELRATFQNGEVDFAFKHRSLAPTSENDLRPFINNLSVEQAVEDGIACFFAWVEQRARGARHFFENILPATNTMRLSYHAVQSNGPDIIDLLFQTIEPNSGSSA